MSSKGERPPKRQRSAPRTTGQDASSARPLKSRIRVLIADDHGVVYAGETSLPMHLVAKLAERVSGDTLSKREVEVLKLMAKGTSNKEIASALFISEGTVSRTGKLSSPR